MFREHVCAAVLIRAQSVSGISRSNSLCHHVHSGPKSAVRLSYIKLYIVDIVLPCRCDFVQISSKLVSCLAYAVLSLVLSSKWWICSYVHHGMGRFAWSAGSAALSLHLEFSKNWPANSSPSFQWSVRKKAVCPGGKAGLFFNGMRGSGLEDIPVDLHAALKACSVEATMGFSGYMTGVATLGSQVIRAIAPGVEADSSYIHSFSSCIHSFISAWTF